jgi:hypothetical protein
MRLLALSLWYLAGHDARLAMPVANAAALMLKDPSTL